MKVFVSNKASFWNFFWHTFTLPRTWRGLQFQRQMRQSFVYTTISTIRHDVMFAVHDIRVKFHGNESITWHREGKFEIFDSIHDQWKRTKCDDNVVGRNSKFRGIRAPFSNHCLFLSAVFVGALVITTWLLRCQDHLQTDTSGYGNCSGLPNCIGTDRQTRSGRFDGNNWRYAMHEFWRTKPSKWWNI